ncbi:MAG: hypothetical protein QW625_01675 [Candidatus Nanoarchaeia archaeon]
MRIKITKKATADLLVEVIISTIIFFLIITFLFVVQLPQLRIKAAATVVSADTALSCDVSLTNLLRTHYAVNGLDFATYLSINFEDIENNENMQKEISNNVSKIFDNVWGSQSWELNISLPKKNISIGKMKESLANFTCNAYVPLPPYFLEKNCKWSNSSLEAKGNSVEFKTPDGTCSFKLDDSDIGVVSKSFEDCEVAPLPPFSIMAEQTLVVNDSASLDFIYLPLLIKNRHYTLFINETNENLNELNVTLTKDLLPEDCAIKLTLATTANISVVNELAQGGK